MDISLNSLDNLEDYTFINDLLEIIENNNNSKNIYVYPLQWIIIEYIFQCYDCNIILDEGFKCESCDILRCKFHHYVNSISTQCVECQKDDYYDQWKYNHIYKCVQCNERDAYYGSINNVTLCSVCVTSDDDNVISFGSYCSFGDNNNINCCGTGWFINKKTKKMHCMKHKNENDVILTKKINKEIFR
jgi:hypothetical protein